MEQEIRLAIQGCTGDNLPMAKKLNVFLSSTGKDLAEYRAAIMARLRKSDYIHCDGMEEFGARPERPVDFCRKRAHECDVYVGLIGFYRGADVPGDSANRSFTEMEYEVAREAGKQQLIYIVPDDFNSVALPQTKKAQQQQAKFRGTVLKNHVVSKECQTPDGLAAAVAVDLSNLLAEKIAKEIASARESIALPGQQQAVAEAVAAVAQAASVDDRMARALKVLAEHRVAEAKPLLLEIADEKAKKVERARIDIERDSKDAAAAYRHLGAIAGFRDPRGAVDAYQKACLLDPNDADSRLWLGWNQLVRGNLDEAESQLRHVAARSQANSLEWPAYWAVLGLGDIEVARGHLDVALSNYERAKVSAENFLKSDPANSRRQRDLAVVFNKIGDVLADQGALSGALAAFNDSLSIVARLAKSDPGNAGWQRDLSVSFNKIGEVLVAQGALGDALKAFRDSLAIAEHLAKSDPENAEWQRDLSISFNKIGDVLGAQGALADALPAYRSGRAIAETLVKSDPSNAEWQRDLSVSFNKIGDVLVAQGILVAALKEFREGLDIRRRLAEADPSNTRWQRDLSVSYDKIGDVLAHQDSLIEALNAFHDSLAIRQRLVEADAANAGWQRDLFVSFSKIGDVLTDQGMQAQALEAFQSGLAIVERIAKGDPGNAVWQRDLSVSFNRIGDVLKDQGALADALAAFHKGLAIAERLAAADSGNAEWQRDLSVSFDKIGEVLIAQGALADALKAFRDGLTIADRLTKADPGNVQWQVDLLWSHSRLARHGDDSKRRWTLIVDTLRSLKAQDRLSAEQLRRLSEAESELAKFERN